MSIIIKGMDMPKASNEDCIAVIRSNGKVEVWQTGMKEFEAQAIQIPTPHGRLIDKDFLMKWLEITEECKDCKSNNYGFCSKATKDFQASVR